MANILLPSWIFKNPGQYFMVAIKPDGTASVDGGHSTPKGVATAKELFESIACIKPEPGTKYVMVKVEEVPAKAARVNRKAIADLNSITPSAG